MRLDPVRWIFVTTGGTPVIDVKNRRLTSGVQIQHRGSMLGV